MGGLTFQKKMTNDSTIQQDKFRLKFFIEYGAGSLWADNEAAFKKFDVGPLDEITYNLDGKISRQAKIRLPDELEVQRQLLVDLYKTSFDQNDIVAGPTHWTSEQRTNFYSQTKELYKNICDYLGDNFEITYNQDES